MFFEKKYIIQSLEQPAYMSYVIKYDWKGFTWGPGNMAQIFTREELNKIIEDRIRKMKEEKENYGSAYDFDYDVSTFIDEWRNMRIVSLLRINEEAIKDQL